MAATKQTTIIPHSQEPLITYEYPSTTELDSIVFRSAKAQKSWKNVSLEERVKIGYKFMVRQYSTDGRLNTHCYFQDEFKALGDQIPLELTKQMGR